MKIAKDNLEKLYELISENRELYFANQMDKPPKDIFFPQSETLYSAWREQKKVSIEPEKLTDEDFVIFGVKPCDLKGIEILDKVYLSEPVDTYYAARRDHGTIIVLACSEPEETCFCTAFGIEPFNASGDITIWFVDETVYWQPVTSKGNALTENLKSILEDVKANDQVHLNTHKQRTKEILKKLPFADLSLEGWHNADLMKKFESPLWDDLHKACLACGTCTFLCPTCQCYDIKDYSKGGSVKRYRCWDSCMYSDFTLMAHGNNRTTQMQRFRQRFMHKLVYFPENYDGIYSCVGCGLCVEKCPSALNIVKVIKAFSIEDVEKGRGEKAND